MQPNRLMDAGGDRPFLERAELQRAGPRRVLRRRVRRTCARSCRRRDAGERPSRARAASRPTLRSCARVHARGEHVTRCSRPRTSTSGSISVGGRSRYAIVIVEGRSRTGCRRATSTCGRSRSRLRSWRSARASAFVRGSRELGWWIAVVGGSLLLLSMFLLIVRIAGLGGVPRRRLRRVRQGRGVVRAGRGRARHRGRRAAADRPGQVPDVARRAPRVRRRSDARRAARARRVWTLPSVVFLAVDRDRLRARIRIPPPDRLDAARARRGDRAAARGARRITSRRRATCIARAGDAVAVDGVARRPQRSRASTATAPISRAAIDGAATQLRALPAIARAATGATRERARIQVDVVTGRGPLGGGDWLFDALAVPGIGDMLAINPGVEASAPTSAARPRCCCRTSSSPRSCSPTKRPSDAMPDFAMGVDLDADRASCSRRARPARRVEPRRAVPVSHRHVRRARRDHARAAAPALPRACRRRRRCRRRRCATPRSPAGTTWSRTSRRTAATSTSTTCRPACRPIRLRARRLLDAAPRRHDVLPRAAVPDHEGGVAARADRARVRAPRRAARGRRLRGDAARRHRRSTACSTRASTIAQLGSTALAVVALAEYQRATGDTRYLPLATKLAAFAPVHAAPRRLVPPPLRPADASTPTTTSRAALLLRRGRARARAHVRDHRRPALRARRPSAALDWLVDWYDFFIGGFFYGEEHWTCIAAEAIWPAVQKPTSTASSATATARSCAQQQPRARRASRRGRPRRRVQRHAVRARRTTRRPARAPRR